MKWITIMMMMIIMKYVDVQITYNKTGSKAWKAYNAQVQWLIKLR